MRYAHSLSNNHKKIKKICQPLEKLNISYFSHVKLDNQNQFSVICNRPEFIELYYSKEYYNHDLHSSNLDQFGRFVVWDYIPREGRTLEMGKDAADYGILHTFSMIEKSQEATNIFHFSTHIDDEIINQNYLSNIDLLNAFIGYFKTEVIKSRDLSQIHQQKTQIKIPDGYHIRNNDLLNREQRNEFLTTLKNQRDDLADLTSREIDCLQVYAKGNTAKEVGLILGISKRTVEHHLMIAKEKLNVTSKSELIGFVLQNSLLIATV